MAEVFRYTGVTSGGVVAADESDVDSTTGRPDTWTVLSKTAGMTIKHDTAHLVNTFPMIRYTRAASTDNGYTRKSLGAAISRMQASMYMWWDTLPTPAGSAEANFFVFRNASTFMGYVGISKTGGTSNRMSIGNATNAIKLASVSPSDVPTGQLIRVEAAISKGTTTTDGTLGYAYALGNSNTYIHEYTATDMNTGTTDPIEIRIGLNGATASPASVWYGIPRLGNGATGWLGPDGGTAPVAIVNGKFQYLVDATASTGVAAGDAFSITQLTGPTPTDIEEFEEGKWFISPDASAIMTFRITINGTGGSTTYDQTVPSMANAGSSTARDFLVWNDVLQDWV